jgi:hypothetical protein
MRLFELDFNHKLLPGQHAPVDSDQLPNAIDFVKKNCQQYIKEVHKSKKFLYRGFGGGYARADIFTGKPQDYRRPIGSQSDNTLDVKVAKKCNELLSAAGFTALRDNSLFCNPIPGEASDWGKVYVMFFLDGYSFGYSRIHTYTSALGYNYPTDTSESWGEKRSEDIINMPVTKEYVDQFVRDNEFSNTDLSWE